jgi:UDP-N-acetylmuramyl tripeptide synthase
MAIAAAVVLGVPPRQATRAAASLNAIAGRYTETAIGGHRLRTMLAKNPASWAEVLTLLAAGTTPVVISVNAREADGTDTSWLYDVPFEVLRGRPVAVTGERAADLAVRLAYAEINAPIHPDVWSAVRAMPPGPVDLAADYTSFHRLQRHLRGRYSAGGAAGRTRPAFRPTR